MKEPLSPVRRLTDDHEVDSFDCGEPELNVFLQRYALLNQRANSAQTYVSCAGKTVAVTGFEAPKRAIEQPNAGKQIPKKMPKSAKTSGISWRQYPLVGFQVAHKAYAC